MKCYFSRKYRRYSTNANVGELNLSEIEDLYPGILIDVYPEINELSDEIYGYGNNKYLEDLFKLYI